MDVIGHQYIGVHTTVKCQRRLAQVLEISEMVDLAEETGLSVIPALHHMLRYASQIESRHPWHELVSVTFK